MSGLGLFSFELWEQNLAVRDLEVPTSWISGYAFCHLKNSLLFPAQITQYRNKLLKIILEVVIMMPNLNSKDNNCGLLREIILDMEKY